MCRSCDATDEESAAGFCADCANLLSDHEDGEHEDKPARDCPECASARIGNAFLLQITREVC